MRLLLAIVALMVVTTVVEARTRITVNKQVTLRDHPYLFQRGLEQQLCVYVAWGVPPEIPPGHPRLGKCPHRSAYVQTPYY